MSTFTIICLSYRNQFWIRIPIQYKVFVKGRASFIPSEKDAFYRSPVEWNKSVGFYLGYFIK